MTRSTKNLIRVTCFCGVFLFLFLLLEKLCYNSYPVSPTWDILQEKEAQPLDILFMGNSHAYCSIDTAMINQEMEIESAVLGSPAQSIEVTLENLKVLLKYQKPRVIVLEANAVIDSTLAYLQDEKQGYLYDNLDGIQNYLYKVQVATRLLNPEDILQGTFQLLRPTEQWHRGRMIEKNLKGIHQSDYDERGSRKLREVIQEPIDLESIQNFYVSNKSNTHTAQFSASTNEALIHFLNLTKENGIEVWMIKTPTAKEEIKFVEGMNQIKNIARDYDHVTFIKDFHTDIENIGLTVKDYYDKGHLNWNGAKKFTRYFIQTVKENM